MSKSCMRNPCSAAHEQVHTERDTENLIEFDLVRHRLVPDVQINRAGLRKKLYTAQASRRVRKQALNLRTCIQKRMLILGKVVIAFREVRRLYEERISAKFNGRPQAHIRN